MSKGELPPPQPTPPPPTPIKTLAQLKAEQQRYQTLRYNAALVVLAAAPALALLPPRKFDIFTFGLGASWVFCLGELANQHGRDPWRGFRRFKDVEREKEKAMMKRGGRKGVVEVNGELVSVGGWKGEKIVRDVRPREEQGQSISELIMQQVWDVWEQKDRNQGKDEEEKK